MGSKVLIDTNIIVYHFGDSIPETEIPIIRDWFKSSFNISIITKMEFLGWSGFDDKVYQQAESFLSHAYVLGLDENIANKVIQLKRRHKFKLPDAIIAATCLIGNYMLVTRNTDDFKGIDGLNLYNPFREKMDQHI